VIFVGRCPPGVLMACRSRGSVFLPEVKRWLDGIVNLLKLFGGTGMAGSGEAVCAAPVRPLWPCR
jgi:hypothetical protein